MTDKLSPVGPVSCTVTLPLRCFSTSPAWWTWGGICGSTSYGCPMACVAVDHSHIDGNNPMDTDSLFSSTPLLCAQLAQLQSTLSQQMNKPTFQLKPLGAALRLQTTQKKQVSTIQRNIHRQFYNSLTATLNKLPSFHDPLHTLVRTSCSQAVKPMKLRIVAFVSQLPED